MASIVTISGASNEQLAAIARARFQKRLRIAATLVANEMKTELVKLDNIRGDKAISASTAGGYPSKITGVLSGSVTVNMADDGMTARVGSPVSYAKFLQLGTRKMAARPWLTLAWNATRGRVMKILGTGGGE